MENAAARDNFVSGLYEQSVKQEKERVLDTVVAPEHARMHRDAAIHLHDLEGYRFVYNCCTPMLQDVLAIDSFIAKGDFSRIAEMFEKLKSLIANLAVCQTGGIGFANFDGNLAATLEKLGVACSEANQTVMMEMAALFLHWVNTTRTRYCREPYYISLNLGLATSDWGRCISKAVIKAYSEQPMDMMRPNIIFKVKADINGNEGSPNHDLFRMALHCTARKMIPTYLLMDSQANLECEPEQLGIMGCRTRVYQNSNGQQGTIGRGNVAYVSINLPQIALQSASVEDFTRKLAEQANACKDILLARKETLKYSRKLDFVFENHLWNEAQDIEALTRQGTLSLGFIGLAETVEILIGEKLHCSSEAQALGYAIVEQLRKYADNFRQQTGLNFTLLATPGEMISGRFAEADKKRFNHPAIEKEFYTNSFHIEVNSGVSLYDKLRLEGRFHALCNGGSISYVEFKDAPMENAEALADLVAFAACQGVSYLGFNFPLDICKDCNCHGTFDGCPACGSKNIKRIRRVSGYLEDLNYFTRGKTREAGQRRANAWNSNEKQE
jgi:anaerobic ribonucleoside-triphosphate reductase